MRQFQPSRFSDVLRPRPYGGWTDWIPDPFGFRAKTEEVVAAERQAVASWLTSGDEEAAVPPGTPKPSSYQPPSGGTPAAVPPPTEEPKPLWPWLVGIGGVTVVIAGVVWYTRPKTTV